MKVYVISKSGKPLMPTERFGKVRRLLKSGKAKVVHRKPFTIQLLYETAEIVQPLILGVDTGVNHIGVAVTKEDGEPVFLGELETRTIEVSRNMKDRCEHRRARRRHRREKRKRRAKAAGTIFEKKKYQINGCEEAITCKLIKPGMVRFENRKRMDKWLTPTCTHLLQTHINFIKKIAKILPIAMVNFEYAKFDLHKINNPDVRGKDYQNGRKKGYANTSEYVLCRDKHTCQLCKAKSGKMHVHHVVWQSENGSDTPENLVTLCEKCHKKVHSNQKADKKIKGLFEGIKKRHVHATILNSILPKLFQWLKSTFENVNKTWGYETKEKRWEYNLPKSHVVDAYLIAIGDKPPDGFEENDESVLPQATQPKDLTSCKSFLFKQFRRHNRANIKRQEDRKYYIGKKKVAVNRNKRTGQTFDSLKDLVTRGAMLTLRQHAFRKCAEHETVLNLLTVKPATRPKRSTKPFGMGDVVKFKGKIYVVKGFTGNYLGFVDAVDDKYNKNMKEAELVIKNQGIVCI